MSKPLCLLAHRYPVMVMEYKLSLSVWADPFCLPGQGRVGYEQGK